MDNRECPGPFRTRNTEGFSLILASGSPRRRHLLQQLGLTFQVKAAAVEELFFLPGMEPEWLAMENSRLKADAVAESCHTAHLLGADTIVVLDNAVLGKPRDIQHAVEMLSSLCGRWHQVITGVTLITKIAGKIQLQETFSVSSDVFLADVGRDLVEAYCRSGEPLDKAGGYAVQGAGAFMVREIRGSWTNVVGLPLFEVIDRMLRSGMVEPC